jgi:RNA polymerase sigma factor (sigma-70 family)
VADEGELERMQTLHAALGVLTEQEREVITLFFGLETGEKITQIEIGKRLGVTNVTVGNIKKRALEKIKKCYN